MSVNESFPLALPEGTVLAGQYTIESVLGQGGFGITYRAIDYKTGQKVAVKEFFPDTLAYREMTTVISYPGERTENFEYGKESFLQEAQTLAEFIGCENIVRIHSYFEENQTAYFVMDYIEGTSFDQYIKQHGGKISCEDAKRILIPIMDALAVVHSKGIIHRDVTPDNIFITNDGTVKLLDFGAARYSLGDKSRSLDVILKHGFAPKEQYTRRGKQGPYTDIYSLGATFYFALTGRRPPDSVDRLEEDDLIPPSSLGVQITDYEEQAILQAMSVQVSDRFQSMTAFKNVFMNQVSSAPAASPVKQQFFSAPASEPVMQGAPQQPYAPGQEYLQGAGQSQQQYAPTQMTSQQYPQGAGQSQQQYAPTQMTSQQYSQGAGQPYYAQQSAEKKPLNKKLIAIAASAVGVLILILAIVIPIATASKLPDSVISGKVDDKNLLIADSDHDVGNANVIGSVGIIQAGGLYSNGYYIDNNFHDLLDADGNKIFKNLKCEISNLCFEDGNLYFYYSGDQKIHYYNTKKKKNYIVAQLEEYTSDTTRFFVTPGYWFIYNYDDSIGSGKLHRISRVTGEEEESLDITRVDGFTIANGNIYYITQDDEGCSAIFGASATDFSYILDSYYYRTDGGQYTCITAGDDGNVYSMGMNISNDSYSLAGMDSELVDIVGFWSISDIMPKMEGVTQENLSNIMALDNHFVFNYSYNYNGSTFCQKYCVTGFDDNSFNNSIVYPLSMVQDDEYDTVCCHASMYKEQEYTVIYMNPKDGIINYKALDSDGREINS